jgi:soluble lytic murein transglycosylase-like protein
MLFGSTAQANTRQSHVHKHEAKKQKQIKQTKQTKQTKHDEYTQQLDSDIKNIIQETEQQYKLPKNILTALIEHESSFDVKAVNASTHTASYGLGQITIPTAKRFCDVDTRKELFHSHTNIKCTAKILRRHMDEYGGLSPALAAYRAGSPCKTHSRKLRTCTSGDKEYVEGVLRKLKNIRQRSKMIALEDDDD